MLEILCEITKKPLAEQKKEQTKGIMGMFQHKGIYKWL